MSAREGNAGGGKREWPGGGESGSGRSGGGGGGYDRDGVDPYKRRRAMDGMGSMGQYGHHEGGGGSFHGASGGGYQSWEQQQNMRPPHPMGGYERRGGAPPPFYGRSGSMPRGGPSGHGMYGPQGGGRFNGPGMHNQGQFGGAAGGGGHREQREYGKERDHGGASRGGDHGFSRQNSWSGPDAQGGWGSARQGPDYGTRPRWGHNTGPHGNSRYGDTRPPHGDRPPIAPHQSQYERSQHERTGGMPSSRPQSHSIMAGTRPAIDRSISMPVHAYREPSGIENREGDDRDNEKVRRLNLHTSTADGDTSGISPTPRRKRAFGQGLARLQSMEKGPPEKDAEEARPDAEAGGGDVSKADLVTPATFKIESRMPEEGTTTQSKISGAPPPPPPVLAPSPTLSSLGRSTSVPSHAVRNSYSVQPSFPRAPSPSMQHDTPISFMPTYRSTPVAPSPKSQPQPKSEHADVKQETPRAFSWKHSQRSSPQSGEVSLKMKEDAELKKIAAEKKEILDQLGRIDQDIEKEEAKLATLEHDEEKAPNSEKTVKAFEVNTVRMIQRIDSFIEDVNETASRDFKEADLTSLQAGLRRLKQSSGVSSAKGTQFGPLTMKVLKIIKLQKQFLSNGSPEDDEGNVKKEGNEKKRSTKVTNMVDIENHIIDPASVPRRQHVYTICSVNSETARKAQNALSHLDFDRQKALEALRDEDRNLTKEEYCNRIDKIIGDPAVSFSSKLQDSQFENIRKSALFTSPSQLKVYHENIDIHAKIGPSLEAILMERRKATVLHQRKLAAQYIISRRAWASRMYSKSEAAKDAETPGAKGLKPERTPMRSSSRLRPNMSGVARSELELTATINHLAAVERMKTLVKLPIMITDDREWRALNFPSKNGLRVDPVKDLEEDRLRRPWTEEEKDIFVEKYLQFPKQFRRIATYLEHRSTSDCILFYYKFQKSEELSIIRKKRQKEKRKRLFSEVKRTSNGFMSAPQPVDMANLGAPPPPRRAAEAATAANRQAVGGRDIDSAKKDKGSKGQAQKRKESAVKPKKEKKDKSGDGSGPASKSDKSGDAKKSEKKPKEKVAVKRKEVTDDDILAQWSQSDRSKFRDAIKAHGKDFKAISGFMGNKSMHACKIFFSKFKKKVIDEDVVPFDELYHSIHGPAKKPKTEKAPKPKKPSSGGQESEAKAETGGTNATPPMPFPTLPILPGLMPGLLGMDKFGSIPGMPGFKPNDSGAPGMASMAAALGQMPFFQQAALEMQHKASGKIAADVGEGAPDGGGGGDAELGDVAATNQAAQFPYGDAQAAMAGHFNPMLMGGSTTQQLLQQQLMQFSLMSQIGMNAFMRPPMGAGSNPASLLMQNQVVLEAMQKAGRIGGAQNPLASQTVPPWTSQEQVENPGGKGKESEAPQPTIEDKEEEGNDADRMAQPDGNDDAEMEDAEQANAEQDGEPEPEDAKEEEKAEETQ